MHACETNHDLEDTENNNEKKKFVMTNLSSKSVSAITLGTKSRGELTSTKPLKKKIRSKRYRKGSGSSSRVYRLLHANGIVPFIHLPLGVKTRDYPAFKLPSSKKTKRTLLNGEEEGKERKRNKKTRFESNSSGSSHWGDVSASRSKGSSITSGNEGEGVVTTMTSVSGHPAASSSGEEASARTNNKSSAANALLALRSQP